MGVVLKGHSRATKLKMKIRKIELLQSLDLCFFRVLRFVT